MARRDAAGRVAMLIHLLSRQGPPAANRTEVGIPMTRSDMANYLGLSLESVVRAIRRLERQGIVEFAGRHTARILDRHRLEALVSNI